MNKPLLAAIAATMLISSPALAIPAEEAVADYEFCKGVAIEQIEEQSNQQARNSMARMAVDVLSSALLGGDPSRSVVYAGRNTAYGTLSRQQSSVYQRRALEQQCMAERRRGR